MLFDTEIEAFQVGYPALGATALMSALLIFITINIALKIRKKAVTTGIQTIIGQPGLVLNNPEDEIQVRIGAEIWTATSSDELTAGDTIKVLEVNGMLLRVAKSVTE